MSNAQQAFLGLALCSLLVAFLILTRGRKVETSLAGIWGTLMLVSTFALLFPQLISEISDRFGFVAQVNFVFACAALFLLGLLLLLSVKLTVLNKQLRKLAQDHILLQAKTKLPNQTDAND